MYVSLLYQCAYIFSPDVYLCDLKVFEWGQGSAAGSEQAKLKTAKPSYCWEAAKRPIPHGQ